MVLTARHAGASAELASVTTSKVLLNLTGAAAVTHAATFELEYQAGPHSHSSSFSHRSATLVFAPRDSTGHRR